MTLVRFVALVLRTFVLWPVRTLYRLTRKKSSRCEAGAFNCSFCLSETVSHFLFLGIISLATDKPPPPPSVRIPSGGLPYTLGFFLVEFTFAPDRRRSVSFLWHFTATSDYVSHVDRRREKNSRPVLRQARTLQPSQAVEVWTFLNRPKSTAIPHS